MTYYPTVTSKGTITVPAKIREQLGIKPGMRVAIEVDRKGNAVIEPILDIEELRLRNREFMTMNKVGSVTDEQITRAWQDAATERYRRSLG